MISLLKFKNPSITLETNTVGICPFIPENNEIDKLGRKNYQIDLTKKKDMIIGCSDIKVEKDSAYDDLNYIEYSIFRIFRKRNLRKISIYESLIKNGKSRLSLEKLWQSVGSLTAFTSQVCQT